MYFKKIGVTITIVLFVTISTMLFVLLTKDENQKMDATLSNVIELSELMTKSISFAMAEGTTDVEPLKQINISIEQINEVTNKSAVNVDAISHSADGLITLTTNLNSLLHKFKVSENKNYIQEEVFSEYN